MIVLKPVANKKTPQKLLEQLLQRCFRVFLLESEMILFYYREL